MTWRSGLSQRAVLSSSSSTDRAYWTNHIKMFYFWSQIQVGDRHVTWKWGCKCLCDIYITPYVTRFSLIAVRACLCMPTAVCLSAIVCSEWTGVGISQWQKESLPMQPEEQGPKQRRVVCETGYLLLEKLLSCDILTPSVHLSPQAAMTPPSPNIHTDHWPFQCAVSTCIIQVTTERNLFKTQPYAVKIFLVHLAQLIELIMGPWFCIHKWNYR